MASELDESKRREYLRALGLPLWLARGDGQPVDPDVQLSASVAPAEADATVAVAVRDQSPTAQADRANDAWAKLEHDVKRCTQCRLHETRTQAVFGAGDKHAALMIVGEAPGAEEDRVGEPFAGRTAQMLNAMLHALGLTRDAVFVANVIKCRPPQNRDPRADEVRQCHDYLQHQLALVRPSVVMSVGRIAAQTLLECDLPLGKMRGKAHVIGQSKTPLVVTYHPAYLMRTPAQKALAWQDLKKVRTILAGAA